MMSLRALLVGILLLTTATGAAQGRKKPKAALTCASKALDGTRIVLGKGKWRLENPVGCLVTLTAPDDQAVYVAEVWTEYKKWDDAAGKSVGAKGEVHSGEVSYWADAQQPFTVALAESVDFVACVDFVVNARVSAPEGKWQGKLTVKQLCPD
jgi:hypothetical protein